ncbi:MAG: hypothetical protein V2A77_01325, partial [Pseudomonadota bacterium]
MSPLSLPMEGIGAGLMAAGGVRKIASAAETAAALSKGARAGEMGAIRVPGGKVAEAAGLGAITPQMRAAARGRTVQGNATTAFGIYDPNKVYNFRAKIVSLEDLVPSHLDNLEKNPAYPQELQPRGRERAASADQINKIAKELSADAFLTDVKAIDRASPIIKNDYIVLSGNGRTLGIRLARQINPEGWAAYQAALKEYSPMYGIDPAKLANIPDPVLVRELAPGGIKYEAFVEEANAGTSMTLSAFEKAVQDASKLPEDVIPGFKILPDETLDNALMAERNAGLVRIFINQVAPNERASLATKEGKLAGAGLGRLKDAILAKTYPGAAGKRMAETFTESIDPGIKNIEAAVYQSLPYIARNESMVRLGQRLPDYAISEDIAKATNVLARLKQEHISVPDYLSQFQMFDRELSPVQENILGYLDSYSRSPRVLREFFIDYAKALEKPESAPNLLGGTMESKEQLLEQLAKGKWDRERAASPLFEQAAAEAAPTAPIGEELAGGARAPEQPSLAEAGRVAPAPLEAPSAPVVAAVAPSAPTRLRKPRIALEAAKAKGPEVPPAAAGAPPVEPPRPPRVFRQDVAGFDMAAASDKPQGLYMTITEDAAASPHLDVGDTGYWASMTAKNPLEVDDFSIRARGVTTDASAGVAALARLESPAEFTRLQGLSKSELVAELNQRFPGPDYSRYADSYELMEVYGAQLARQQGYDAIILRKPTKPTLDQSVPLDWSEYVALNKDAVGDVREAAGIPPVEPPRPPTSVGPVPGGGQTFNMPSGTVTLKTKGPVSAQAQQSIAALRNAQVPPAAAAGGVPPVTPPAIAGAPAAGGGTAKPRKTVPYTSQGPQKTTRFPQFWNRTRNVIEAQGPFGKVLGGKLHLAREVSEQTAGGWSSRMPTVKALTEREFDTFVDLAEGKYTLSDPVLNKAMAEWTAVRDEIWNRATAAKLKVGKQQDYFPHVYEPGTFSDRHSFEKAAQYLIKSGQAKNLAEAEQILYKATNVVRRKQGNLEYERIVDLPGYKRDKDALYGYIISSAERISHAEQFGPHYEKSAQILGKIRKSGYDDQAAANAFNVATGSTEYGTLQRQISGGIRAGVTLTSMQTSAIANASQLINTATVGGVAKTIRNIPKAIWSKDAADYAERIGVTLDYVLRDLKEGGGWVGPGLIGKVGAPGFMLVEKFQRRLAALVGREFALDEAAKAMRGSANAVEKLDMMGLDGKGIVARGGNLTDAEMATASRRLVERTQFKVDPQDLPLLADSPWGKVIMQFRTFSYN